ncbi:MAG TPA: hypothetical protein VF334_13615, partial [Polyangia bacterium]
WFLHLLVTRCWMRDLRARTAVAAAARASGKERERLVAEANKIVRQLEREKLPGTSTIAKLTRAAIAVVGGDKAAAIAQLDEALVLCQAAHMGTQAAVTRLHRARLAGGGAALAEAERALVALGVRAPMRLAAAVSPIPTD